MTSVPPDEPARPDEAAAPADPAWSAPAFAPPPPPPPTPPGAPGWGGQPPEPPGQSPDWGVAAPLPGIRYDVPQDQKNMALLSTLGMIIVGFLSPLIVYIITNGDPAKRFANDHAKEGLNFCIAGFVAGIVTILLCFVLIGFLLFPVLIGWTIWVIVAGAIQANNGEAPHYPLVPKILK